MKRLLIRHLPFVVVAALAALFGSSLVTEPRTRYLTRNPSVTQKFVAVPSESSLNDLCFRLRGVQGVTGVSYREFSPSERSAVVTVFFNPRETSVRQVKIFMLHTKILWEQEMKV